MKLTNVIASGAILLTFALAPVVSNAQDKKSDIKKDQNKETRDKAHRNEAVKKGHPKEAVKEEKKVHADKKDIREDKKGK